jgi:hypothetical protein
MRWRQRAIATMGLTDSLLSFGLSQGRSQTHVARKVVVLTLTSATSSYRGYSPNHAVFRKDSTSGILSAQFPTSCKGRVALDGVLSFSVWS